MNTLTEPQQREIARGLAHLGFSFSEIAKELELTSQRAVQKFFNPRRARNGHHPNGYFGTKVCRYVDLERRASRGLSTPQEQLRAILHRTINLPACFSEWVQENQVSGFTSLLMQRVHAQTFSWQYGLGHIAFLESMMGPAAFISHFVLTLSFEQYQPYFLEWAAAPEQQSCLKKCSQPEFNQLVKAHITEIQLKLIAANWPSEECIQNLNAMLFRICEIHMDSSVYARVYYDFLNLYFGLEACPPDHNPADPDSMRSMKAVENYRGGPNHLHCHIIWQTTREILSTASGRKLLEDVSQCLRKDREASLLPLTERVAPPPPPLVTPDTPLTDLQGDMDIRLMNLLTEKCRLKTLAHLAHCTSQELLQVTDIGQHYLEIIRSMLEKYGGSLSMPATEINKWRGRTSSA